jgi:hypothetical protein
MSLRDQLARHESAQTYAHAAIRSAESFRSRALAEQAARADAETAKADADRAASLPVIADGAGHVAAPAAPSGPVTVTRPQASPVQQSPTSVPVAVVALPAANVDALLAIEAKLDPAGVQALRSEWGSDMGANLGYAYYYLAGHLSDEGWEKAKSIPHMTVPILRLLAELGRAEAHSTATPSTTPKGSPMAETLSRPDAERRFRELTSALHDARFRQDRLRAKELADERDRLSQALFPGDGTPDASVKRVLG